MATAQYHRSVHRVAGEALAALGDPAHPEAEHNRAFFGVVLALPESALPQLRGLLWEMVLRLGGWSETHAGGGDLVVQVNLQFFPVSKPATDQG